MYALDDEAPCDKARLCCSLFGGGGGFQIFRDMFSRSTFFIASGSGQRASLDSDFMPVIVPDFSPAVHLDGLLSLPASGGDWRKGATLIDCSHGRQRRCCASLLLHYLLSNAHSADDAAVATIAGAADTSASSLSQPSRVGSDSPGGALDVDDSTQGRGEVIVTLEDVDAILEDLSVLAAESGEEALVSLCRLATWVLAAEASCVWTYTEFVLMHPITRALPGTAGSGHLAAPLFSIAQRRRYGRVRANVPAS